MYFGHKHETGPSYSHKLATFLKYHMLLMTRQTYSYVFYLILLYKFLVTGPMKCRNFSIAYTSLSTKPFQNMNKKHMNSFQFHILNNIL